MDVGRDERIVMTMDAGGTSFVFGAVRGGEALLAPLVIPARGDDLAACLQTMYEGFDRVRALLEWDAVAIGFAFPGPADYEAGVIGDLPNLPAFRGGVPLGPILADRFGMPVFINNDGDLFTYGEAMAGLLPATQRALADAGSDRGLRNLFGVTLGTGFGAGLVSDGRLYLGDNGAGMEIWSTRSAVREGYVTEASISAGAISRTYAREAGISAKEAPDPEHISAMLDGSGEGNRNAAVRAFAEFGTALGNALADAVCLTDSLVVVGGGVAKAHRHFLGTAVSVMNGKLRTAAGGEVGRMEVTAYNLEDPAQRAAYLNQRPEQVPVPGSNRTVAYNAAKSVGVGVSVLGTSEAVALGAYAHALATLDG